MTKMAITVINILKLSPEHFVSNIRYQHPFRQNFDWKILIMFKKRIANWKPDPSRFREQTSSSDSHHSPYRNEYLKLLNFGFSEPIKSFFWIVLKPNRQISRKRIFTKIFRKTGSKIFGHFIRLFRIFIQTDYGEHPKIMLQIQRRHMGPPTINCHHPMGNQPSASWMAKNGF